METNTYLPSRDLYNKVRAGFVAQGSSLSQWCKAKGMNTQNALSCLTGTWDGPKAKTLRAEIIEASGIAESLTLQPMRQGAA